MTKIKIKFLTQAEDDHEPQNTTAEPHEEEQPTHPPTENGPLPLFSEAKTSLSEQQQHPPSPSRVEEAEEYVSRSFNVVNVNSKLLAKCLSKRSGQVIELRRAIERDKAEKILFVNSQITELICLCSLHM